MLIIRDADELESLIGQEFSSPWLSLGPRWPERGLARLAMATFAIRMGQYSLRLDPSAVPPLPGTGDVRAHFRLAAAGPEPGGLLLRWTVRLECTDGPAREGELLLGIRMAADAAS